jgi:hypothetical protein
MAKLVIIRFDNNKISDYPVWFWLVQVGDNRIVKYEDSKEFLRNFYSINGLESFFNKDNDYLERAFMDIYELWRINYEQINEINYVMIAEAPLWGKERKYIYNPATKNSQFFYRSDLGDVIKENISTKQEFLKACNNIGLIVLDISPYPLSQTETAINYRKTKNQSKGLTKTQYKSLVELTLPIYFEKKLELISNKKSKNIKVFFRYQRVKKNFEDLIIPALIKYKFIQSKDDIGDISQSGGCVDKLKLNEIIN